MYECACLHGLICERICNNVSSACVLMTREGAEVYDMIFIYLFIHALLHSDDLSNQISFFLYVLSIFL